MKQQIEIKYLTLADSYILHTNPGDFKTPISSEVKEVIINLQSENEALTKDNERLREALQEISEGKGAYSIDPLTHAGNTIEAMKDIATEALNQ